MTLIKKGWHEYTADELANKYISNSGTTRNGHKDVKEKDLRGRYFHPQAVEVQPCGRFAHNLVLQRELWKFTEELIAGGG